MIVNQSDQSINFEGGISVSQSSVTHSVEVHSVAAKRRLRSQRMGPTHETTGIGEALLDCSSDRFGSITEHEWKSVGIVVGAAELAHRLQQGVDDVEPRLLALVVRDHCQTHWIEPPAEVNDADDDHWEVLLVNHLLCGVQMKIVRPEVATE